MRGWGAGCTCRGFRQGQQQPRRPEGPDPRGEGLGGRRALTPGERDEGGPRAPTPGERDWVGEWGGKRLPRAPVALVSASASAAWEGAVGERGAGIQGHSQSLWEIDSGR